MLLDVNDLTKIYGKTIALDGLCLHLRKGRIIGLLGPNGSGKTTLLKTVAGLLQPTSGEVPVNGIPVGEKTKSLVSFLPERTYLASNMKVCETLSFFEDFYSTMYFWIIPVVLFGIGAMIFKRLKVHFADVL